VCYVDGRTAAGGGIGDPDGQHPQEGYAFTQKKPKRRRLAAAPGVFAHILNAPVTDAEVGTNKVTYARAQSHVAPPFKGARS
jgi:hypothetical protein